jgi:hypothetical protein
MKKFLITAILFLILSPLYFGQNSSSYSRLGLGDVEYTYSARRAGMGDLGVSVADADFINTLNPAGWYKLNDTRIEFGLYFNGMFLSDNNNSGYFGKAQFSGFTVAFPASRLYGIGIAAGLVPYSNVSYNTEQTFYTSNPYKLSYDGSGGLTKAFIGTSYKLPFNLVLGSSLDYYFGNLNYKSRLDFLDSPDSYAEYENSYRPDGVGYTFGFISPNLNSLTDSGSVSDLRLGGSLSYIGNLNIDSIVTSTSSTSTDTVSYGKANADIPFRLTLGVSTVFNKEYLLSLDYSYQPWANYKINGIGSSELRNFNKFSLGFEYRPERNPGASFWEQIMWRAGLSYEGTQYLVNNQGINQYSVSGGFSMPFNNENTLDVAVLYSMRGSKDLNLIKENDIRISLGISFGEVWFIRREN